MALTAWRDFCVGMLDFGVAMILIAIAVALVVLACAFARSLDRATDANKIRCGVELRRGVMNFFAGLSSESNAKDRPTAGNNGRSDKA